MMRPASSGCGTNRVVHHASSASSAARPRVVGVVVTRPSIITEAARGIPRSGLRDDPWNLNRFRPAEGARRSCLIPAASQTLSVRAAV